MGLRVKIFRGDYDSDCNAFRGARGVTLVNVPGLDEPDVDYPGAELVQGPGNGGPVVAALPRPGMCGPMFGGTYAGDSYSEDWQTALRALDGQGPRAQGFMGAAGRRLGPVPVHDRFETWAQYDMLSR